MKKAIITNDGSLIMFENDGVIERDSNGIRKVFNSPQMLELLKEQGYEILNYDTWNNLLIKQI